MKHIQAYESLNNYKVGDYVLLKYSNSIFKIIEIAYKWSNPYNLEYYSNNKLLSMNCRNEHIERYATPLEIEKYELEKTADKYNL